LYVTSRDQYQALRLATVVHVMKSTLLCHRLRSLSKILSQITGWNRHGGRGHGGWV